MVKIPDNTGDKYERIVHNYRQIRTKIRPLLDDVYIDNTNNKVLFKEMRDMMIDILQLLKNSYGIQKDDDVD